MARQVQATRHETEHVVNLVNHNSRSIDCGLPRRKMKSYRDKCEAAAPAHTQREIFLDHEKWIFLLSTHSRDLFFLYVPLCEYTFWQRIKQFKQSHAPKSKERKIYAAARKQNHNIYYWLPASVIESFPRV